MAASWGLLMLVGLACRDADPGPEALPTPADVRIMSPAHPGSGPGWSLELEPDLVLADRAGRPHAFHRIDQVLTLPDSSILVSDQGDVQLLRFDTQGRVQGRLGGRGFGPGEFRTLSGILVVGDDSVLVFDPASMRLTTFEPDGTLLDTRSIVPLDGSAAAFATYRMVGRAGPDRVVLAPGGAVARAQPSPGGFQETRPLLELDPRTGTLRKFPREWTLEMWGDEMTSGVIPFGVRTLVRGIETTLLVADAHAGWIERWGGGSQPSLVIEFREPRPPLSAEAREAWLAARTSGINDPAGRLAERRRLESMPFPDFLPHFDDILPAPRGRIWLRDTPIPGASAPVRWRIIDHAGTEVGGIDLPPSFQPTEIHEDRILGLWTDDLGVQTVRRFRVGPPPT